MPVEYLVYRGTSPGVTPDESNLIGTTSGGTTSYTDDLPANCASYYYIVTARICCSEGNPSPECAVDRPSAPQCPTGLAGAPTAVSGELSLSWKHPTLRDNLTLLPSSEISATHVYYDTLPGSTVHQAEIAGNGTSAILTGLTGCKTYYVHARTVDQCGHMSSGACMGNEISVALAEPCDPSIPVAPSGVALTPLDNRVDLAWNANQVDCDLAGYRLYYGTAPGSYGGTGAAEGNSPITLLRNDVTQGTACGMSLTGLPGCETYYVAVTSYDRCAPAHESPKSSEVHGMTTCVACGIQAGCPSWIATAAAVNKDLHLEVYTDSPSDETLARITPTWTGTAKVTQVLYGRPLAQVWNSNGSAGQDGAVGLQPSGAVLNITDVTVPSWTSQADGEPLVLVFDTDVRDIPFNFTFKNPQGGSCSANGTNRGAAIFDDFDDGNITGWTVRSGTWLSNAGELYQSNTSSNRTLIGADVLTDITYEAKIKVTSGTAAYLVFRYTDDNNFYTAGIISNSDVVRLSRMRSGTYTTTGNGELRDQQRRMVQPEGRALGEAGPRLPGLPARARRDRQQHERERQARLPYERLGSPLGRRPLPDGGHTAVRRILGLALAAACIPFTGMQATAGGDAPLRIAFTAETNGNLLPCPCPGNPLGGLDRRIGFLDSLRAAPGGPILIVDAGRFFPGSAEYPLLPAAERPRLIALHTAAAEEGRLRCDRPRSRLRRSPRGPSMAHAQPGAIDREGGIAGGRRGGRGTQRLLAGSRGGPRARQRRPRGSPLLRRLELRP